MTPLNQALKKTATKGDKKKKKEVADTVIKLESELHQKHKQELEALEKGDDAATQDSLRYLSFEISISYLDQWEIGLTPC